MHLSEDARPHPHHRKNTESENMEVSTPHGTIGKLVTREGKLLAWAQTARKPEQGLDPVRTTLFPGARFSAIYVHRGQAPSWHRENKDEQIQALP